MLYNHCFGGIIGQKLENNGYTFWEVWNRIMGKNLSIIASCLCADGKSRVFRREATTCGQTPGLQN